jgi:hypothetical protein
MKTHSYRALRIRQTQSGNWLVLFGAPATEIIKWSGIPQKKVIGSQETTGFQRDENPKRINQLEGFYGDSRNIIQNPLLCSLRKTESSSVVFHPDDSVLPDSEYQAGYIIIQAEEIELLSLLELFRRVKSDLEKRVPSLTDERVSDDLLKSLKQQANLKHDLELELESSILEDIAEDLEEESSDEDVAGFVFSDESHIQDFWEEISARISILEELGSSFSEDEFLGFSKDAMLSFLKPVIVVDGQHRLRGAVELAKRKTNEPQYKTRIEQEVFKGTDPDDIQDKLEIELSRRLPISLLLNDDPAEHVFQFVVVNQKATPIGRALLGTIVSTSLSNDELSRVSERLEKAGIHLEESRAVTYLARYPDSPFYGCVERGLATDRKNLLQWNVLASLVNIFRDLNKGRLFHEKNDYADKWKNLFLADSSIISGWEPEEDCSDPLSCWRKPDGPWRLVFIEFWKAVRDRLADSENDQAWHYWGSTKQSNIFNKISLTILSADFFQYMSDVGIQLESAEQVPVIVDRWLTGVSDDYFNRDWKLKGVKKDSPGIRQQWAKQWVEYRKYPQRLPRAEIYSQSLK